MSVSNQFQFAPLKIKFIDTHKRLVNNIDLMQIETKSYDHFMAFQQDILWFVHNCYIMHETNQTILNATEILVTYVDEEITSLKLCIECFSAASKRGVKRAFVSPCSKPHPLVWALSEG